MSEIEPNPRSPHDQEPQQSTSLNNSLKSKLEFAIPPSTPSKKVDHDNFMFQTPLVGTRTPGAELQKSRFRNTPLKSCLSASKPNRSVRKSVNFGLPTVAEFNKDEPTTLLTPLTKKVFVSRH